MRALHAVAITVGLLTIGAASASLAAAPKPASSIAVTAPGLGCSTPAGADSFEARGWSWGAENPVVVSGGGSGAGKAVISALGLTRLSDACSPLLLESVVTGLHLPTLTLTQYNSSGAITTTVALSDVTVTDWKVGGSSTAAEATEEVQVAFRRFQLTDVASGNKFCWDVSQGKAC